MGLPWDVLCGSGLIIDMLQEIPVSDSFTWLYLSLIYVSHRIPGFTPRWTVFSSTLINYPFLEYVITAPMEGLITRCFHYN